MQRGRDDEDEEEEMERKGQLIYDLKLMLL